MHLQERREAFLRRESERTALRTKLVVYRWLFLKLSVDFGVASSAIREPSQRQRIANEFDQRGKLLSAFAMSAYVDGSLLLRAVDLCDNLQSIGDKLVQQSPEENESLQSSLLKAKETALLALAEATHLLVTCSLREELEADWKIIQAEDDMREMLDAAGLRAHDSAKPSEAPATGTSDA